MSRLQSYYEQLQFPIKTLFFSSFLIAIGSLFVNPYISTFINLENTIILTISQILLACAGIILSYFPFYIFIKLLAHNKDEQNIVLTGVISYMVFTIVMSVLTPVNLPPAVYSSFGDIPLLSETQGIYNIGIFGLIAIYLTVNLVYQTTKDSKLISLVSYIDRDTIRLVYSVVASVLLAFGFVYLWPIAIEYLYKVMNFISTDVNNPMTMFAYGGFERVMTLFNLDAIVHQEFWFGPMGGTWVDLAGVNFNGDLAIWTAQLNNSINVLGTSDAGRFTSAYYILNIFAIPGYLVAVYSTFTNKKYLKRNILILSIAVIVSIFSGILLPVEILMLVTSPMLYLFHLFSSSLIFAILSGLSIYIGFSYTGSLLSSNPGNIIDLFFLLRKQALVNKVMILILIGLFVFLIYFIVTRLYYSRLALDILNIGMKKDRINDFVERVGGLENIKSITNTPTRIHVQLEDRDKLNVAGMHRQGVTRIVETKLGFVLSIGSSAYIYQQEIIKQLKEIEAQELIEEVA